MAAATVIGNSVNATEFKRKAGAVKRLQAGNPNKILGLMAFDTGTYTVASTSVDDIGDEVFVFTFPDNCVLVDLFTTVTDMDTNGAPALVFSTISETLLTSGGTETVLTATTTIGQAGGSAAIDAAKKFTDVSNQKLGIKITTAAATAAAGTVRFRGLVQVGPAGAGYLSIGS